MTYKLTEVERAEISMRAIEDMKIFEAKCNELGFDALERMAAGIFMMKMADALSITVMFKDRAKVEMLIDEVKRISLRSYEITNGEYKHNATKPEEVS
jgi:hypothetical protein